METVDVLEQLFDNKILSVLQLFVENENNQYYLREIAKLTKVSPATTYRILNKLVDLNVLEIQEIKTLKQSHLLIAPPVQLGEILFLHSQSGVMKNSKIMASILVPVLVAKKLFLNI